MSAVTAARRVSTPQIRARKGGEPIVCLTAYTTQMARWLDPHVDLLLVGDSLGMVIYGFDSTLPVTLDMMIAHGSAVMRGATHACVIVDLPFGSYQASPEQAFHSAARVMSETGARGVKLEGGEVMAETVRYLAQRGIPVCAHLGLTPQTVHALGGYRVQGRGDKAATLLRQQALELQDAGASMLVLEMVPAAVAAALTTELSRCATIGIGAGRDTAGQVLVLHDMLGINLGKMPRFVRNFMDGSGSVRGAIEAYVRAVKDGSFPVDAQHAW